MGRRREARQRAVQFLFQYDLNRPEDLEKELEEFWRTQNTAALADEKNRRASAPIEETIPTAEAAAIRLFAEPLIRGTIEHQDELDELIKKYVKNWNFNRIAVVDRNVLRLAIFEMLYREDIPPIVSINEAVDIAKRFSTEESGRFVNGILDQVRAELLRPARTAK